VKRRGISISEFADDVRSGMADYELMEKYRLTSEQLQATYKQLLESGRLNLSRQ